MDRFERAATDLQWRAPAVARFDSRAHLGKWRHDARHRPPRERFIAKHFTLKLLPGKNAAQHAHGRAGVPTVKPLGWRGKLRPTSLHFDRAILRAFPRTPESAHAVKRAKAIARSGKIMEAAGPVGNRRQHRVAVRNGFVARNAHHAAYTSRRTNGSRRTVCHEL